MSLVGRTDLAGEIYRQLRSAIVERRLQPGDCLPPSRELARRLSVSRTTVTVAYERLNGEGFVTSRVGAGTFVSPEVPGPSLRSQPAKAALRPRPVWDTITPSSTWDAAAVYDFRSGIPDASLFPYAAWRRLMTGELRAAAVGRGNNGDPAGHPALRHAIARHLGTSRGVAATADDIVVTNGTQQAIDLVARVLLEPGDRVAVEDPAYVPPALLFRSLGLRVTGIPVDRQGLVVDALPPDTRLVYVTPSHQYPLGSAMSLPRRLALLAWAEHHNAAVIEDDYDSEFRYAGRPIEPLQTVDTHGRVLYMGSFSKTMLPTLRLGFVVVPEALRRAVHAAKYVTDWHTALPTQMALARFIDQGLLARHVRRMRSVYQARHQTIVDLLTDQFAAVVTVVPSAAGLHVSAESDHLSPDEVRAAARRAQASGVVMHRLAMFRIDQPARAGLVLGYGAIDTPRIAEGMRRLRRAFDPG